MPFLYRAFGICIQSDIRLDELTLEENLKTRPDVCIVKKDLGVDLKPFGTAPGKLEFSEDDGAFMVWHGIVAVRVTRDCVIHVQPYPTVPEPYLAFPLLGPVMGWTLDQLGYLVLHGSALKISGKTAAFLGDKGAGKSTTAAAFLNHGAELLTDDLLVINTEMDQFDYPVVLPGFSQLKLNEDSIGEIAIKNADIQPLVFDGFPKRQFRVKMNSNDPTKCDYVFILRRGGTEICVDWLSPIASLGYLFRFSYKVRFTDVPDALQRRAEHFQDCSRLADVTKIGILRIPHDLQSLPQHIEQIKKLMTGAKSEA